VVADSSRTKNKPFVMESQFLPKYQVTKHSPSHLKYCIEVHDFRLRDIESQGAGSRFPENSEFSFESLEPRPSEVELRWM